MGQTRLRVLGLVALTLATAAAQNAVNQKGSISGTVVDAVSGAPLAKVKVVAAFVDAMEGSLGDFSDAAGNFKLTGLTPGTYNLLAERNAYLPGAYGAKHPGGTGTVVSVAPAEDVKDLQIRMFPFGVIAGTVRDSDGEPLVGIAVNVFRQIYDRGRPQIRAERGADTDDLGQYRIANLPPGKYYVKADDQNDDTGRPHLMFHPAGNKGRPELVAAFYPGVTDPSAARLVEIAPGSRITGIDISMPRVLGVKVTVQALGPGNAQARAMLTAGPPNSPISRYISANEEGNGVLVFRNVPPGSYVLSAEAQPAQTPAAEEAVPADSRVSGARGSMPLEVGTSDIDGVKITLTGGVQVAGEVAIDDSSTPATTSGSDGLGTNASPPLQSLPSTLVTFEQNAENDPSTGLKPDRTFDVNLTPGQYTVYVEDPVSKLVVKSIKSGELDVLRNGLAVAGSGPIPLEIVLAPIGGILDGIASDKEGKPAAGATVVAIPSADLRARRDRFFDTTTDQNGRFEFSNIPPGDYQLFAWDDVTPDAWYDPEFLRGIEGKGDSVSLKPNGHENRQLRLQQ